MASSLLHLYRNGRVPASELADAMKLHRAELVQLHLPAATQEDTVLALQEGVRFLTSLESIQMERVPGAAGIRALRNALSQNQEIRRLDLSRTALGKDAEAITVLGAWMRRSGPIQMLNLSHSKLSDRSMGVLFNVLAEQQNGGWGSTLRELRASGGTIGIRGGPAIKKALQRHKYLQLLDLSVCYTNDGPLANIFQGLGSSQSLRSLLMRAVIDEKDDTPGADTSTYLCLSSEVAEALAAALLENTTLRRLDLTGMRPLPGAPTAILASLHGERCAQLEMLGLDRGSDQGRGHDPMCEYLRSDDALLELDTTLLQQAYRGRPDLADGIHDRSKTVHPRLRRLSLRGCRVNADIIGAAARTRQLREISFRDPPYKGRGIEAGRLTGGTDCEIIFSALQLNHSVTKLKLLGARLTSIDVAAGGLMLKHNVGLQQLDLGGAQAMKQWWKQLLEGLRGNVTLQHLLLRGANLSDLSIRILGGALGDNCSLRTLDLRGDCRSAAALRALAAGLQGCLGLRELRLDAKLDGSLRAEVLEAVEQLRVAMGVPRGGVEVDPGGSLVFRARASRESMLSDWRVGDARLEERRLRLDSSGGVGPSEREAGGGGGGMARGRGSKETGLGSSAPAMDRRGVARCWLEGGEPPTVGRATCLLWMVADWEGEREGDLDPGAVGRYCAGALDIASTSGAAALKAAALAAVKQWTDLPGTGSSGRGMLAARAARERRQVLLDLVHSQGPLAALLQALIDVTTNPEADEVRWGRVRSGGKSRNWKRKLGYSSFPPHALREAGVYEAVERVRLAWTRTYVEKEIPEIPGASLREQDSRGLAVRESRSRIPFEETAAAASIVDLIDYCHGMDSGHIPRERIVDRRSHISMADAFGSGIAGRGVGDQDSDRLLLDSFKQDCIRNRRGGATKCNPVVARCTELLQRPAGEVGLQVLLWRRAVDAKRDASVMFRAARDGRPLELQKRLRLGRLAGGLSATGEVEVEGGERRTVGLLEAARLGRHWECVKVLEAAIGGIT